MGGTGLVPVAPGTAGSAVACLIFLATHQLGFAVHVVLIAVVMGLGIWASGASEAAFGQADDGRIVIDEVAGQWIALSPQFVLSASLPVVIVTAFVAFRVFDIWKPGPVRWAEQRFAGGLGVMADDVVAGVLAACVSVAAVSLWGVM